MGVSTILSAIAPQYDSESARDTFISLAETRVNRCAFNDKADLAVAYMAAHMITVKNLSNKLQGIAVGEVSSMKEGDLALSFRRSATSGTDNDLASTEFGKQFLILQKGSIIALGITGRSGADEGFIGEDFNFGGGFVTCD